VQPEQRRPRSLPILIAAAVVGVAATVAAVVIVVSEIVDAVNENWSFDPIGLAEIIILVAIPIQLWRYRDKYL
jgi:hypothetical protein